MLTALPPGKPVATEGDRPIVVGRVGELDFYLLAHEAKNRGYHMRAVVFLRLAAADMGVDWAGVSDPHLDWMLNLEPVDEAWANRVVLRSSCDRAEHPDGGRTE